MAPGDLWFGFNMAVAAGHILCSLIVTGRRHRERRALYSKECHGSSPRRTVLRYALGKRQDLCMEILSNVPHYRHPPLRKRSVAPGDL